MNELPANPVSGFLIYDFNKEKHVFRVYYEEDGVRKYKDRELRAEDIKITINDPHVSLFDDSVNYSSQYLKRK